VFLKLRLSFGLEEALSGLKNSKMNFIKAAKSIEGISKNSAYPSLCRRGRGLGNESKGF